MDVHASRAQHKNGTFHKISASANSPGCCFFTCVEMQAAIDGVGELKVGLGR